jgi:hypothetical protein
MNGPTLEPCPGCGVLLPPHDGPTHRYIGASPACWALYTALGNGGEPPIAPTPALALLNDAYAAQHPGTPTPQATQSVAIHLLTLHGVLARGVAPENAIWVRRRALREHIRRRHSQFTWLAPPAPGGWTTIADIVREPSPEARADRVRQFAAEVLDRWWRAHGATLAAWYDTYVLAG